MSECSLSRIPGENGSPGSRGSVFIPGVGGVGAGILGAARGSGLGGGRRGAWQQARLERQRGEAPSPPLASFFQHYVTFGRVGRTIRPTALSATGRTIRKTKYYVKQNNNFPLF